MAYVDYGPANPVLYDLDLATVADEPYSIATLGDGIIEVDTMTVMTVPVFHKATRLEETMKVIFSDLADGIDEGLAAEGESRLSAFQALSIKMLELVAEM